MRFNITTILLTVLVSASAISSSGASAQTPPASDIIRSSINHWRGVTSVGEMTMIIHRPDWERSMSMQAWTRGDEQSLVRVTSPARDAGNATLINGDDMWSFAPRINRVVKIPSSMMGQSWMGSDFSNKDISKSTDVLTQYDHTLIDTQQTENHEVFVIEATPHDDAPVVWGKEVYYIRDDYVLLKQEFWSQDGELIKFLESFDIVEMGGRNVASRMRMQTLAKPNEWTEIVQHSAQFDVELSSSLFTVANLRNPRQ